ncbi:MAG: CsbD family protein [Desulfuromonadales bacterium]
MDREKFAVRWHLLKGKAREFWGELTGDEIEWIGGRRDQLVGKLEEKYGMSHEEAERQVDEFISRPP